MGGVNQVFTILDPNLAGDGWPGGTALYFEEIIGNDENFQYWHSLRFDGDNSGLTVSIRDFSEDISVARTITIAQDTDTDTSWFGLIDEYGRRKVLRFSFTATPGENLPESDESDATPARQIKNLQVFYKNSLRNI